MRLKPREIETIKAVINDHLSDARIYLFGSRLDESKKGGDIDLFISAEKLDYPSKVKIRSKLERFLGKPVDIVFHRDFSRPIEQKALEGIRLN